MHQTPRRETYENPPEFKPRVAPSGPTQRRSETILRGVWAAVSLPQQAAENAKAPNHSARRLGYIREVILFLCRSPPSSAITFIQVNGSR